MLSTLLFNFKNTYRYSVSGIRNSIATLGTGSSFDGGRPLTYMRHGRVFDTVASALVLLGASVCILENCEPGIDRRTLCRGGLCWTCEGIKL
eukprot:scaffold284541_cov13-Tisochrysis_lutea.AAC.2